MATFEDYAAVIFWNFKRRDNVEYNFAIVKRLIDDASNDRYEYFLYYKPICILIASIIECTLYDLLCRIREHVYEKINLDLDDINKIKNLDLPTKLKNYNDICRKYELLGKTDVCDVYKKIEALINARNRVHIQNDKNYQPHDESDLWTNQHVKEAGNIIEYIFLYLTENYPRPEGIHDSPHLDGFPAPWEKL